MRCEIRRDDDGQDYEFVVAPPDGPERIERFADPAALIGRSVEYFRLLMVDGWEASSDTGV